MTDHSPSHIRGHTPLDRGSFANTFTGTVVVTIPAEGTVPVAVNLPAKLLRDLVKPTSRRNAELVSIEPTQDGLKVTVDGVEHTLVGDPLAQVAPALSVGEGAWPLVALWNAQAAKEALSFALQAASKDDSRPHLNAVYLSEKMAVASDGHRLHMAPLPTSTEPLLLPATSAETLRRLLAHGDYASFHRHEGRLRVQGERWAFECPLSEERFPAYKDLIPDAQPVNLSVDAQALRRALAQVSKLASGGLRLTVNGALTVGADSHAGAVEVRVPTRDNSHEGDDLHVGIDPKYLAAALPRGAEQVRLGFSDALSPVRVDLPSEQVAVIMPMRI
jgi:DNA polymerase III sliding clamp (beta) subunit (PCNA family)